MPKAGLDLLDDYKAAVKIARGRCNSVDDLLRRGAIKRYQAELLYESIFLGIVKRFERVSEEFFIGLVSGTRTTRAKGYRCLVSVTSPAAARRVVIGERSYLDWIPYNKFTPRRAWAFFSEGRPFTKAPKALERNLERIILIRNAIAHESPHAMRQYKTEVLAGLTLLPREMSPGGFLMSLNSHTPRQTRFEVFASYLVQSATHFLQ